MNNAINREIMTDLGMARAYESGMVPPADYYVATTDPNWRSQKARRKNWRRLSNAPKAVRKRVDFKEHRHG